MLARLLILPSPAVIPAKAGTHCSEGWLQYAPHRSITARSERSSRRMTLSTGSRLSSGWRPVGIAGAWMPAPH